MANQCSNRISIRCDIALERNLEILIDCLKNEDEDTVFDFNAVIPMPPELNTPPLDYKNLSESDRIAPDEITNARLRKSYGANNWKDWSIKNWGTEWNAYEDQILEQGTRSKHPGFPHREAYGYVDAFVIYTFSTAWTPPEKVIHQLRKECPDFQISAFYDKPETEMAGYY